MNISIASFPVDSMFKIWITLMRSPLSNDVIDCLENIDGILAQQINQGWRLPWESALSTDKCPSSLPEDPALVEAIPSSSGSSKSLPSASAVAQHLLDILKNQHVLVDRSSGKPVAIDRDCVPGRRVIETLLSQGRLNPWDGFDKTKSQSCLWHALVQKEYTDAAVFSLFLDNAPPVKDLIFSSDSSLQKNARFNFHSKIFLRQPALVKALLDLGVSADHPNETGGTALMVANHPDTVSHLMRAGANIHATNAKGESVALVKARAMTSEQVLTGDAVFDALGYTLNDRILARHLFHGDGLKFANGRHIAGMLDAQLGFWLSSFKPFSSSNRDISTERLNGLLKAGAPTADNEGKRWAAFIRLLMAQRRASYYGSNHCIPSSCLEKFETLKNKHSVRQALMSMDEMELSKQWPQLLKDLFKSAQAGNIKVFPSVVSVDPAWFFLGAVRVGAEGLASGMNALADLHGKCPWRSSKDLAVRIGAMMEDGQETNSGDEMIVLNSPAAMSMALSLLHGSMENIRYRQDFQMEVLRKSLHRILASSVRALPSNNGNDPFQEAVQALWNKGHPASMADFIKEIDAVRDAERIDRVFDVSARDSSVVVKSRL